MMEARETVRVQVSVSSIRVTTPVPPCGLLPGLTPERTLLHTPSPPAMALCVPRMPPTSLCVSFRPPPCSGMRATPGPWTSSCQWVQSTSRLSCTTRPTATCAGSWARTGACSSPKPQQSQGRLSARCALVLLGLQAVQQQYPSSSNLVSTQACECLAFVMVTCMHRVTSFSNGASQALAVNSPNMPCRAVPCHAAMLCCAVCCIGAGWCDVQLQRRAQLAGGGAARPRLPQAAAQGGGGARAGHTGEEAKAGPAHVSAHNRTQGLWDA